MKKPLKLIQSLLWLGIGKQQYSVALKQYPESLIAIDKAIQIAPQKDSKLYGLRGRILDNLTRDPEAEEAFSESIKLKPNAVSYSLRAKILKYSNRERSHSDYTKAIEIQPNFSASYGGRSFVAPDASSALKDLDTAIQLDPDSSASYAQRSIIRKSLGDIQGAIADITKAIDKPTQTDPEDVILWYSVRAEHYKDLKQWDKAISDITKCIELSPSPKKANYYLDRALTYDSSGDRERALADLNKGIEIEPDNADLYLMRGTWYLEKKEIEKSKGDLQKAEELYTQKIQLSPENPILYKLRGNARRDLGKTQESQEDFQKVKQILSTSFKGKRLALVNSYYERGKLQQAFYTKEIEANPRNFKLYFYRGIIVYALADYEAALEDFNHSLQLKS